MKLLIVVLFCALLGIEALPSQYIIDGHDAPDNVQYVRRIRSFRTPDALQAFQYTGFFITESAILTVAQAIHNFNHWEIEDTPNTFIATSTSYYHENYDSNSLVNNIGILYFDSIYTGVLPILPSLTTVVEPTFFVFGFGITDNVGALPTTLQRGFLGAVDLLTCRETFGLAVANDNVFCGQAAFPSDGFTRICSGDQGGPVVNAFSGELIGIASFWWNCTEHLQPQGFTLLSNYVNWLANNV